MRNRDAYWAQMEKRRNSAGRLPENAFDFISIHPCEYSNEGKYSLMSPMVIIENSKMIRPAWENDYYTSLRQANKAAEIISAITEKEIGKKIEIVFCPN
jgi:hypothetical protein